MVFEGCGFESTSWYIRDMGLSRHLCFLGVGGIFFGFVWVVVLLRFVRGLFFKGNFFFFFLVLWEKFVIFV